MSSRMGENKLSSSDPSIGETCTDLRLDLLTDTLSGNIACRLSVTTFA